MSLRVSWSARAEKDREALSDDMRRRVLVSLGRYAETGHGDVRALVGLSGLYRLRVGDYRIVFQLPGADALHVVRVRHRRDAYRE